MAFSGSRNYTESYTAASIIARALKRLGIQDADESVDSTEESDALEVLNLIIKEWMNQGAEFWLRNTGHLFLVSPGTKNFYTFGTSGTATFTSQYYVTTLASAGAASDGSVTVTDDTNISNADVILIEQDDGTLLKTTVNGAPAANVVTLTAGLDSAASAGNIVYTWTGSSYSISDKVVRIVSAKRRITNTDNAATDAGYMEGTDTPLDMIGAEEYQALPTKLQTGQPISLFLRQETLNPECYLWPTGGSGKVHSVVLEYNTYLQDLDGTTNNLDLPAEGVNPLCWQLAAELAPEYGIPEIEQKRLWAVATNKVNTFFDYLQENAPVSFGLSYQ